MKKKLPIIIIAIVLVAAIISAVAVTLGRKDNDGEKELISPEAKNDHVETKLPNEEKDISEDDKLSTKDVEEWSNTTYDDFMELYNEYQAETDEGKKREYLDQIQKMLDSVSEPQK